MFNSSELSLEGTEEHAIWRQANGLLMKTLLFICKVKCACMSLRIPPAFSFSQSPLHIESQREKTVNKMDLPLMMGGGQLISDIYKRKWLLQAGPIAFCV